MTISGKYELLRPLSAAGFRSFHARHVLTGQEVMVHFLGNGQRYEPRPVSDASSSPSDARAQVLDAGTYEGTQFLVTYPVEDFKSLSEWLETVAPVRRSTVLTSSTPSRGVPIPSPPPPSAPIKRTELAAAFQDVSPRGPATTSGLSKPDTSSGTRQTGGFTARFGGGLPEPPDPRQQLQIPRQAPPPPPPAPSTAQSTGSFTAIFGRPGNPAPLPAPAPASPAPSPALPAPSTRLPASNTDSGSFSKMFGQQAPPPLPPPRASSPQSTSPSSTDFNQMFLPPERGNTLPPAPIELGRQRPPSGPASREVGGFTEMFGGGVPSSAPTDPMMPPPQQAPPPQYSMRPAAPPPPLPPLPPKMQPPSTQSAFDGATQVFSGPPLAARNAPAPAPVMPSGPSEFTLIHGGGQGVGNVPFPAVAAPQPQAPPPAAGGGGWMPDLPGANVRPPVFNAPQVSAPSMSGPGISAAGITPPTVRAPQFSAPSMSAPQLDVRMPQMQLPAMQAPPPVAVPAAGGSTFSPVIAALLSCIGTVAVLAIVYVLVKG
jgi:hypothetical protein